MHAPDVGFCDTNFPAIFSRERELTLSYVTSNFMLASVGIRSRKALICHKKGRELGDAADGLNDLDARGTTLR